MEGQDSFIARFSSSDSIDVYPENTLSSFTCQFDHVLDLGNEDWECGVTQLHLNPITSYEYTGRPNQDHITLPMTGIGKNFQDFQQFIDHIVDHSSNPENYTRAYFFRYLDKTVSFSQNVLKLFSPFDVDYYQVKTTDPAIFCTVNLQKTLLKDDEKLEDFGAYHKKKSVGEDYKNINLYIPVAENGLNMRQILQICIRILLHQLRYSQKETPEHARMFMDSISIYETLQEMNKLRRIHLDKTNLLIQRFIEKFVKCVQVAVKKTNRQLIKPRKLILIYTDIIKPQIFGPSKSRLLHVMGVHSVGPTPEFIEERIQNIQYCRVDKTRLKNISFKFLDEYGEPSAFIGSYNSNIITLHFRRVMANK